MNRRHSWIFYNTSKSCTFDIISFYDTSCFVFRPSFQSKMFLRKFQALLQGICNHISSIHNDTCTHNSREIWNQLKFEKKTEGKYCQTWNIFLIFVIIFFSSLNQKRSSYRSNPLWFHNKYLVLLTYISKILVIFTFIDNIMVFDGCASSFSFLLHVVRQLFILSFHFDFAFSLLLIK